MKQNFCSRQIINCWLALTILSSLVAQAAAASKRPNVILIMADDQGWGDTSYNGHPELKTPNLDDLAKCGLRMDRFYAAHVNCSPTRGSVMTGRHPARYGTFSPGAPIRAQELTVAKVLQSAGYATGHFGKWHLNGKNGDKNMTEGNGRAILADDPLSPGKMGFDEWVSADNFFDLDAVLGRNGVPEKFHGDSSDIITDEALKFIRRQAKEEKQFLSVVWFGSPHSPHKALPADKAAYAGLPEKEQNYYGELTAVDRSVGRLRAALRELKIADNTIFWYCSDNGGAFGSKSTGNLRGQKGGLWEGGIRVPGIVEWPARIAKPFVSQMPLFDRKTEVRSKAIPFWRHGDIIAGNPGHAVLLDWPFKLHTDSKIARSSNQGANTNKRTADVLLYDVSKDPRETIDIAGQEPERVKKMTAVLAAWQKSVDKSLSGADYPGGLKKN